MSIGERIKQARKAKGYTQQELADMVGVVKATICGYEVGNREPDVLRIHALSKALGVTGDWLIESPFAEEAERRRKSEELDDEALEVARDYKTLDQRGKTVVRGVLDVECAYLQRASAGEGYQVTPEMQAYLNSRAKKPG